MQKVVRGNTWPASLSNLSTRDNTPEVLQAAECSEAKRCNDKARQITPTLVLAVLHAAKLLASKLKDHSDFFAALATEQFCVQWNEMALTVICTALTDTCVRLERRDGSGDGGGEGCVQPVVLGSAVWGIKALTPFVEVVGKIHGPELTSKEKNIVREVGVIAVEWKKAFEEMCLEERDQVEDGEEEEDEVLVRCVIRG